MPRAEAVEEAVEPAAAVLVPERAPAALEMEGREPVPAAAVAGPQVAPRMERAQGPVPAAEAARLPGQASARARQLRSVLGLMHP